MGNGAGKQRKSTVTVTAPIGNGPNSIEVAPRRTSTLHVGKRGKVLISVGTHKTSQSNAAVLQQALISLGFPVSITTKSAFGIRPDDFWFLIIDNQSDTDKTYSRHARRKDALLPSVVVGPWTCDLFTTDEPSPFASCDRLGYHANTLAVVPGLVSRILQHGFVARLEDGRLFQSQDQVTQTALKIGRLSTKSSRKDLQTSLESILVDILNATEEDRGFHEALLLKTRWLNLLTDWLHGAEHVPITRLKETLKFVFYLTLKSAADFDDLIIFLQQAALSSGDDASSLLSIIGVVNAASTHQLNDHVTLKLITFLLNDVLSAALDTALAHGGAVALATLYDLLPSKKRSQLKRPNIAQQITSFLQHPIMAEHPMCKRACEELMSKLP